MDSSPIVTNIHESIKNHILGGNYFPIIRLDTDILIKQQVIGGFYIYIPVIFLLVFDPGTVNKFK
jgi:hypothetical protein